MADDHPVGEVNAAVLDLAFDSGTLGPLRSGLKALACRAGLSADRAEDLVLAVHELAANAVHHGAGKGRLRVWKRAGALHCQVEDGDPPADPAQPVLNPLPSRPGHGLWVVRQLADRMRVLSTARGTRATITFNLPRQGCPQV
jgi:anti-sigma regulatory factor (Ser/Thr protein kinase)